MLAGGQEIWHQLWPPPLPLSRHRKAEAGLGQRCPILPRSCSLSVTPFFTWSQVGGSGVSAGS